MTFSTTTISGLPNEPTPLSGAERVPMDDLEANATRDASTQDIANLATKATVGLGNVDNTSDANKPISNATAAALAGKVSSVAGTAPIVSSGGLTPAISITAATASAAGSMSAADKAKLDAIAADTATLVRKFVRNNSGVAIPKGAAVYQTGSSGTTLTVALADASAEATASQTLGLAQETIGTNSNGYVVAVGLLDGISTATLTEGQICWLSETAGQLTTTRPTQPAHGVVCGYCVKQSPGTSGILYVKVDNGLELNELHDVLISGAVTNQALVRASDGLWKNRTIYSSTTPAALGTAAVGTSTTLALADHVHAMPTATDVGAAAASHTQAASTISDSTAAGRALLTAANAAAQRTSLGLGTAATSAATDFATPAALASGLAGKADLVGGVIPSSQIPSIAISDYLGSIASEAAMLALVGQRGDWCIRTDGNNAGAWILAGEPSSTLANWIKVPMPAVPVQSVNGQVGIVVLGPGDVGAATAAQGALAATAIQPGNAALTDAREWTAATIDQAEAEAGTATTRRAFTAQRVFQAIAAWWNASTAKTKLDGIQAGATANSTDAQLRDRSTHTGTQSVSTISGLGTLATQSGTFSGASSGTNTGDVTLAASVADVLNVSGQVLAADDPGADCILFWDESESKLRHLTLGTNLSITGTTLNAAGGGGGGGGSNAGSNLYLSANFV